jgi:tRNA(Ile)-lysidine synthase
VQTLAQKVLAYIRRHELLRPGDRVGVAVSGGADSVGLLRLLLELRQELGIVLSVVHFNHKLRGAESDAEEQFVAELARRHKLGLRRDRGDVAASAAEKHLSIEAAARKMRYEYFVRLLRDGELNRVATAHTLDDQAETVLMRVVRGAGTRGLAGIYPQLSVASSQFSEEQIPTQLSVASSQFTIIRPLLGIRRKELEAYLVEAGQEWREDSSNRDLRHARNRVRHGILPRLERNLNPAVREALAETAEIARAEEEYWEIEVARVLPQVWRGGALDLAILAKLPLSLQRRVIRAAAESLDLRLEFRHVEGILEMVGAGSAKSAALPDDWMVSRSKAELRFERAKPEAVKSDYEYCLPVPGLVEVPEVGTRFEAALVPGSSEAGYNPEHLLDRSSLAKQLTVRNWRAGDRFWPAHSKSPKKIKELLQERQVSGLEKKLWPVVASGAEVVWVRGFPAPARLQPRGGIREAVLVREIRGSRIS